MENNEWKQFLARGPTCNDDPYETEKRYFFECLCLGGNNVESKTDEEKILLLKFDAVSLKAILHIIFRKLNKI